MIVIDTDEGQADPPGNGLCAAPLPSATLCEQGSMTHDADSRLRPAPYCLPHGWRNIRMRPIGDRTLLRRRLNSIDCNATLLHDGSRRSERVNWAVMTSSDMASRVATTPFPFPIPFPITPAATATATNAAACGSFCVICVVPLAIVAFMASTFECILHMLR